MYRQSCFYDLIDYQPENKLFVFSVLVFVAEFFLVEDKLLSAMRADNDFIGIFIKIVCVYFKCFAAVGTFSLIIFLLSDIVIRKSYAWSVFEKCFLTDVRPNLWEIFPK